MVAYRVGMSRMVFVGIVCFSACVAEASELYDAQAVMREAPAAWAEYQRLIRGLQCKVDNQLTVDGVLKFHCVSEYKQNRSCGLCVRHYLLGGPRRPTSKAEGFNEHYAFSLRKPASGQDWLVEELVFDWQAVVQDVNDPHRIMQEPAILVHVNFVSLPALFKRDDFRIERVSQQGENVRIDFACPHDYQAQPFFPIQQGALTLRPHLYWCVAEATIRCRYADSEIDIKIENKDRLDATGKFPVPLQHVMTDTARSSSGKHARRVLTYSDLLEKEASDNEFRLTAFGLAEPPGLRLDRPYAWHLWALIIGLVLLFAGFLIRRLALARTKS